MVSQEYPTDIVDAGVRDVEREEPFCCRRRCGARAFAWAEIAITDPATGEFKVGGLGFCGHHFAEHEAKIREQALHVTDHRDRILRQVTP